MSCEYPEGCSCDASVWSRVEEQVDECLKLSDHQIPYYAYGDNEAACDMNKRLEAINEIAEQLKQLIK